MVGYGAAKTAGQRAEGRLYRHQWMPAGDPRSLPQGCRSHHRWAVPARGRAEGAVHHKNRAAARRGCVGVYALAAPQRLDTRIDADGRPGRRRWHGMPDYDYDRIQADQPNRQAGGSDDLRLYGRRGSDQAGLYQIYQDTAVRLAASGDRAARYTGA